MRERAFGPIGLRVLAAFLVVGLSSIFALVIATLAGMSLSRAEVIRDERQALASVVAEQAAQRYATSGTWGAADLSQLAAEADALGAHLLLVDPADDILTGGPVGPGFRRNAAQAPVVADGQQVALLYLGFGDGAAQAPSGLAVQWFALATLIAVAVATATAVLFTKRLTRPLRALTDTTGRFAAGDRAARASTDEPGELGELARTFNAMADQVSRSEEARRHLSADVAHELRTPLTVLQADLEELRDGHLQADPATLAALHDQTLRLSRVVADLAALASAESPGLTLTLERLDLTDLVSDVLLAWRPRMDDAGVELRSSLPMGVWVMADGDRIHEVVMNLLSNALRHSTVGGFVEVRLERQDGSALLEVRDSGSGIAPEDLPYVLDRFYRGGAARPRTGSGLGLALVRALVVAQGGEVAIQSELGQGTAVTVRLPAAEAG